MAHQTAAMAPTSTKPPEGCLLFQVAAVFALPALMGMDGIWLAVTAAELAALGVSVYMFVTKDRKFHYRHV